MITSTSVLNISVWWRSLIKVVCWIMGDWHGMQCNATEICICMAAPRPVCQYDDYVALDEAIQLVNTWCSLYVFHHWWNKLWLKMSIIRLYSHIDFWASLATIGHINMPHVCLPLEILSDMQCTTSLDLWRLCTLSLLLFAIMLVTISLEEFRWSSKRWPHNAISHESL